LEKYCRAEQATDVSTAQSLCMLDTKGYKHRLIICNTYCFSTARICERLTLLRYSSIACRALMYEGRLMEGLSMEPLATDKK
jgi:hypothetical protein